MEYNPYLVPIYYIPSFPTDRPVSKSELVHSNPEYPHFTPQPDASGPAHPAGQREGLMLGI